MTNATQDIKPVLLVLTSHEVKGETGEPTGFYLGEVTHPLALLDAAGISSPRSRAASRPSTVSTSMTRPISYWNSEGFRHAIRNTSRLSDVDPKNYTAIFRRPRRDVSLSDQPGREQRRT